MFPIIEIEQGQLAGEIVEGKLFLHFNYHQDKFSKMDYLEMLDKWILVIEEFKKSDVTEVFSCINKNDDKVRKFQTMFGLEPTYENETHVVYRGEI